MNECESLLDRMPAVAHGGDAWSPAEHAHLASCDDCRGAWAVVAAGSELQHDLVVPVTAIAAAVIGRLRTEPVRSGILSRIPWRGAVVTMMAAAAVSILVLYAPRARPAQVDLVSDTGTLGVLPELQGLSEVELQSVLKTLGPTATEVSPGSVPHLDDLTDAELKQLLRPEGGE